MTIWTVEEHYRHHHHHHHREHKDGVDVVLEENGDDMYIPDEDSDKHPLEALDSWLAWKRNENQQEQVVMEGDNDDEAQPQAQGHDNAGGTRRRHRRLKHHQHPKKYAKKLEAALEDQFRQDAQARQADQEAQSVQQKSEHRQRMQELYANPGIGRVTQHGLMIDAGSTGSRLHVYEWEPRVLRNAEDIEEAVSGNRLSFPASNSRWTDRLRPGLSTFASIADDDELLRAVSEYLQPLLDFAQSVLHAKADQFGQFPIFVRATAGMRILTAADRARVMHAVRTILQSSPFRFDSDEQARVISGEEEAVFDWAGVNFLLGDLLAQSHGSGTVTASSSGSEPTMTTHGALDMGGGSTQISFFEPHQDIMSNLFKLQIGQAKHWNIYAHSFLFYGLNEARDRFHAKLAANKTREERLITGLYNPCQPHGSARQEIRTNIHFDNEMEETWDYAGEHYPSGNGYFQATLVNEREANDVDQCLGLVKELLHLEKVGFCCFVALSSAAAAAVPGVCAQLLF